MSQFNSNEGKVRTGTNHLEEMNNNSNANQSVVTYNGLFQGVIDCSTNPNYPAATVDMFWRVSVAGKIGGVSGTTVKIGDEIICITTNAGGVEASVGADFMIEEGKTDIGVPPTPVTTRTNHPIIAANTVNANIAALDAAIGADNTPIVRTNSPTVVNTTIEAKIQALDTAIGVTPTSTHITVAADSVNQNISLLDAAVNSLAQATSATKVVKKIVGGVGVAACDFNFATAANTTPQNIDLGAIVPAKARVTDVYCVTTDEFTGAVTLVASLGNVTSGTQFSGSHTVFAANAINADGTAMTTPVTPVIAASHVWVTGATPGANWSLVTAGKMSVYVFYNDVTGI